MQRLQTPMERSIHIYIWLVSWEAITSKDSYPGNTNVRH